MKKINIIAVACILLGPASSSFAAVYEFAPLDTFLIYSQENKISLTASKYSYDMNGEQSDLVGGGKTGEMLGDTEMLQLAMHHQLNDQWSLNLQYYKPYYLKSHYDKGIYEGAGASLNTNALASTVKYQFNENWSAFGGLQIARTKADIQLNSTMTTGDPTATGMDLNIDISEETDSGYVAGFSYEIPAIALRTSLTYQSEIQHNATVTESGPLVSAISGGASDSSQSTSVIALPSGVTLDFITGINDTTLITLAVQWREWTQHSLNTDVAGNVAQFANNGITYRLGFINQTTEQVFTFAQVFYEEAVGGGTNPLAAVDGYRALAAGAAYDFGNTTLGFAIEYGKSDDVEDDAGTRFHNNSVLGINLVAEYAY